MSYYQKDIEVCHCMQYELHIFVYFLLLWGYTIHLETAMQKHNLNKLCQ